MEQGRCRESVTDNMVCRPRRLRNNEHMRKMTRETRLSAAALVYPLFIRDGAGIREPIPSMDGQYRYSADTVCAAAGELMERGVNKFLLFGIPDHKDETGSGAFDHDGVVQRGLRALKARFRGGIFLITDVCMCEYTSHGHCGILKGDAAGYEVDNDATLEYLAKIAVSHAEAGADMVAPSDMMDGRVGRMRRALDARGFANTPIMAYSAKYASAFFGPFRDAAGSAPAFGDRSAYQMDWHNRREAAREIALDIEEGADIIMVKPAMAYGDIISDAARLSRVPVAAYSVSGEYAMIKAAARLGLIDEYRIICETAVSIFRAGADILISYCAKEIAEAIARGEIG